MTTSWIKAVNVYLIVGVFNEFLQDSCIYLRFSSSSWTSWNGRFLLFTFIRRKDCSVQLYAQWYLCNILVTLVTSLKVAARLFQWRSWALLLYATWPLKLEMLSFKLAKYVLCNCCEFIVHNLSKLNTYTYIYFLEKMTCFVK